MATFASRAVMPLAILAMLPACKPSIPVFGQCRSLIGRNAADDAAHDFHHGERYLMTDIDGGQSANVFVAGHEGQGCHFIYGRSGPLLRSNKRPVQTLPSGDSVTGEERTCIDQYHVYLAAYNRAFERLDPGVYQRTCSDMTYADARTQFGNEADEAAFVAR